MIWFVSVVSLTAEHSLRLLKCSSITNLSPTPRNHQLFATGNTSPDKIPQFKNFNISIFSKMSECRYFKSHISTVFVLISISTVITTADVRQKLFKFVKEISGKVVLQSHTTSGTHCGLRYEIFHENLNAFVRIPFILNSINIWI